MACAEPTVEIEEKFAFAAQQVLDHYSSKISRELAQKITESQLGHRTGFPTSNALSLKKVYLLRLLETLRQLGRVDTNHINDESEFNECFEHDVEFFKAREDASKAFEPAEQTFNLISAFVNLFVVLPRVQAV